MRNLWSKPVDQVGGGGSYLKPGKGYAHISSGASLAPSWGRYLRIASFGRGDNETMAILENECVDLFDHTARRLKESSEVAPALDELIFRLGRLRDALSPQGWRSVIAAGHVHPLCKLILEDPFARHSFEQPRGYSGDADLLDYVYGDRVATNCSDLGKRISAYLVERPECAATRWRRDYTARLIDGIAAKKRNPEILSVAAGHMREVPKSRAVMNGDIGRIVALDQDPLTINFCRSTWGKYGIETVVASITNLIRRPKELGQFDLIYAMGLYDYLRLRSGKALTRVLLGSLKPGGRLLIANFLNPAPTAGFIEVFMRWKMYYRSASSFKNDLFSLPDGGRKTKFFKDAKNVIGFLEIDNV